MSNRITEVRLLSVPLEKDYDHTFWFNSKEEQTNIMSMYTVDDSNGIFTNFSYQRKDNVIRWPKHFDEIAGCNYVMYNNNPDNGKWYYAFITDMKYVNDERTDITIETDVMQTYMFDYELGPCFIERQHVNDDDIGIHTIPEGLETGEYVVSDVRRYTGMQNCNVVLGVTVDLSRITVDNDKDWRFRPPEIYGKHGNIFSGVQYYAFVNRYKTDDTDKTPCLTDLSNILYLLASRSQSDAVVTIFMAPTSLLEIDITKKLEIGDSEFVTGDDTGLDDPEGDPIYEIIEKTNWYRAYIVENTTGSVTNAWDDFARPTSLNGYTPKNNKLLTYPYTFLNVENNAGGANIYKYEYFTYKDNPLPEDKNGIYFTVLGVVTPGFSIRLVPYNYKGVSGNNNSEGLTGAKLPICSWINDVYTNWLTQQAINEKYDAFGHIFGSGSQVGSGAAMMGGFGALAGGISWTGQGIEKIFNNVKQRELHSLIPPTIQGNINSGDVNFGNQSLTFIAYNTSIKKEYAQIIDNYFNMYGYQVNIVDVPLKNHREYYWYTKTSGANIIHNGRAPIPQTDIDKIRSIYDHGVTFWTSTLNFLDYTIDNPIISTTKEG